MYVSSCGERVANDEEIEIFDQDLCINKPFDGLIPGTVQGLVLAQIVADPFAEYTPGNLSELIGKSSTHVSKALKDFEKIGLLRNISHNKQRPIFVTRENSKRLSALTFLSLAVVDDKLGQSCMDDAIIDYVQNSLGMAVINNMYMVSACSFTGPKGEKFTTVISNAPKEEIKASIKVATA